MNSQYRLDRRLYSVRLFCCPFFRMWSSLFFPTADATFSIVHAVSFPSTVLFQTKLPRLPICTGRQKGSHSFYFKGFWSTTSHYSSPSVCWLLLCNAIHLHNHIDMHGLVCICIIASRKRRAHSITSQTKHERGSLAVVNMEQWQRFNTECSMIVGSESLSSRTHSLKVIGIGSPSF